MTTKNIPRLLLSCLFGGGLCLSQLQAQNPNYAAGDLMLYFQKDGGTETVYVALGSAALLYRGAASGPNAELEKLNIVNINTELTTAFGADWASQTNIYAGLAAARSSSTGTAIVDGDQSRTLYISRARTSVGTLGQADSVPWDLTSSQPYTGSAGQIIAMGNTLETTYTTAVAVSPTSVSTIDNQNPFLAPGIQGTAFGGFAGGVQQVGSASPFGTFGAAGQVEFALDLNRILPRLETETPNVEVSGTQHIGSYEGTIVVSTTGSVSFITSAPVVTNPEIVVEQPSGTELSSGTTTINFGVQNTGTTSAAKTFLIRNTGTATLSGIAVSGATAEFIVNSQPATSIAAGGDASFTVTFQPSAAGVRTATLQISSNDADENPFSIPVTGTGNTPLPPEVPEISVEHPTGTSIVGGTNLIEFGNQETGTTSTSKSFTIRNTGTATLSGISISGATSEFLLTSPPATSIAAGSSTSFTVAFSPAAAGGRIATLQIASNDGDENPFDIRLSGTGVTPPPLAVPEIAVEQPTGTSLADNGPATDFGKTISGGEGVVRTFTIKNLGTGALTDIVVFGDSSEFVVGTQPAVSLAPGAQTTFTVRFQPTAVGTRSGTLRIASNDADENPFDLPVTGTGLTPPSPEINVNYPASKSLVDGARLRLGNIVLGKASVAKVFTIKNTGTDTLTGLRITKQGKHTQDFIVTNPRKNSLPPGQSTTFTVVFKPTKADYRAAEIRIASNDADENPFNITVSGCGMPPTPEIVVEEPVNSSLADGKSTKSFGTAKVGAAGRSKTFTIRNTGAAKLTGIAVSMSGSHAGDFSASKPKLATLNPGASTTFTVSFKPTAAGQRSATLRIASNDRDENPFDIKLTGEGAN
jgi:hypothetical protein